MGWGLLHSDHNPGAKWQQQHRAFILYIHFYIKKKRFYFSKIEWLNRYLKSKMEEWSPWWTQRLPLPTVSPSQDFRRVVVKNTGSVRFQSWKKEDWTCVLSRVQLCEPMDCSRLLCPILDPHSTYQQCDPGQDYTLSLDILAYWLGWLDKHAIKKKKSNVSVQWNCEQSRDTSLTDKRNTSQSHVTHLIYMYWAVITYCLCALGDEDELTCGLCHHWGTYNRVDVTLMFDQNRTNQPWSQLLPPHIPFSQK